MRAAKYPVARLPPDTLEMYCTFSSTLRSPPASFTRTRPSASRTPAAKMAARLPPPEIASPTSMSGAASGMGANAGFSASAGRSFTLAKHPLSTSASTTIQAVPHPSFAAALMSDSFLGDREKLSRRRPMRNRKVCLLRPGDGGMVFARR